MNLLLGLEEAAMASNQMYRVLRQKSMAWVMDQYKIEWYLFSPKKLLLATKTFFGLYIIYYAVYSILFFINSI